MFRRRSDGVEIYFTWPRGTGRVVPDQSVKSKITIRDSIGLFILGIMSLLASLGVRSTALGVFMLVAAVAWFVERHRYLSTLQKVPLHVTTAQVDKAWIQDVGLHGGVMLTAVGALASLGMAWAALFPSEENRVPLFLAAPLILCALIMLYAGIRVLWAKLAR